MSKAKSRARTIKRVILWLLSPLALLLALVVLWFPVSKLNILPPFLRTAAFKPLNKPESREAQWQQDLDYYAGQLPRLHKDLYHTTDKAIFDASVADLSADIPSLTDIEIIVRLMQLTAQVGDGHTTVGVHALYQEPFNFHVYPLGVKGYAEGWYIVGGLPAYQETFGARLVAVEGTPIDQVVETLSSVIAHDNEMQLRNLMGTYLNTPEILQGLGLIEQTGHVTLTVELSDGTETDVTVNAVERQELQDAITLNDFLDEASVPLAYRNEDQWYWYEYLPEAKIVYFQYDRCGNMKDRKFKAFNEEIIQFIDEHDVEQVVVDLRFNGGGNSLVLNPFLKAIEARPNLSVAALIGRRTFSSALMNAIQLDDLGATLVGEPTGGRPNHYGEVRMIRLPNSKLPISYATRFFREIETSDPSSLEPDVEIDLTLEDQRAGRDAVLEEVLK